MSEVLDDDSLSQFKRAVEAVTAKEMSIRKAASVFGVSKSALQRRTTGQVAVNAKCGPLPILTEGEVSGVLRSVDARTKRGQCFTTAELGLFVRRVVEESPYKREIPASFPSYSWLAKFIKSNSKHFSRRKAQNLETCRAIAATEKNVRSHYSNLKAVIESCGDLPPSCIWNLDEIGMCGQGSRNAKVVLASKGKRANVQQSDSRDNMSALVCVNAAGDHLPPFFILPGKNINVSHTRGAMVGAIFAASESSFLVTALFIKYFKWFVKMIPPARPVLVVMDGYKAHFTATTLACARSQGILLYAIPAHTSHFLQPLDVTVFQHFRRELDNEIDLFQKQTHMMVDKNNLAEIGSRALEKALTRSRIVDGFEKTGIYRLDCSKMLAGIIGDKPAAARSTIVLTPTVEITNRTRRKIERQGDDVDAVRALSINHWEMENRQTRKKQKHNAEAVHVHGGGLMTSDEVYELAKQKEEAKATKLRLKAERKEAAALRKAAKAVRDAEAAKAKQKKIEAAAAARVAKAATKAIKDAAKATAKAEKAAEKAIKDAAMTAAKNLKAVGKAKGTTKQRNAAIARSRSLLPAFESSPHSYVCPDSQEAARIERTSETKLKFTSGEPHTNILCTVSL